MHDRGFFFLVLLILFDTAGALAVEAIMLEIRAAEGHILQFIDIVEEELLPREEVLGLFTAYGTVIDLKQ